MGGRGGRENSATVWDGGATGTFMGFGCRIAPAGGACLDLRQAMGGAGFSWPGPGENNDSDVKRTQHGLEQANAAGRPSRAQRRGVDTGPQKKA
jgi:hypothetical protein